MSDIQKYILRPITCKNCGQELSDKWAVCNNCGFSYEKDGKDIELTLLQFYPHRAKAVDYLKYELDYSEEEAEEIVAKLQWYKNREKNLKIFIICALLVLFFAVVFFWL